MATETNFILLSYRLGSVWISQLSRYLLTTIYLITHWFRTIQINGLISMKTFIKLTCAILLEFHSELSSCFFLNIKCIAISNNLINDSRRIDGDICPYDDVFVWFVVFHISDVKRIFIFAVPLNLKWLALWYSLVRVTMIWYNKHYANSGFHSHFGRSFLNVPFGK